MTLPSALSRFGAHARKAAADPKRAARIVVDAVLIYTVGIALALAARILRPVLHIRFSSIDGRRIGHFIGMCEIYLCERALGHHKGFTDIHTSTKVGNSQSDSTPPNKLIWRLYDEQLHFNEWARYAVAANEILPGAKKHQTPISGPDYTGLMERVPAQIKLPETVIDAGNQWAKDSGISLDQEMVVFANRDSAHLSHRFSSKDWSYHDYRDNSIASMTPMAEAMTARGYLAVRIGAHAEEPIHSENPWIFDLPFSGRTEEIELFVSNRCRFFIVTTSGIGDLGRMFRKPVACTNTAPFLTVVRLKTQPADLWIPKHHWSVEQKRFMTFSEIVECGAGHFDRTEQYSANGIELVENTAEEITDIALETDAILSGHHHIGAAEQRLYDRFWKIALEGRKWTGESRIALSFLSRHSHLVR